MSGHLTQVLNNVTAMINQSSSLTGLPPEAQVILTKSVVLGKDVVIDVKQMQGTILPFTVQATAQLNTALDYVTGEKDLAQVGLILQQVHLEALKMQAEAGKTSGQVSTAVGAITDFPNQLTPISKKLHDENVALSVQLEAAQKEESSTKKNYYYLLALGPLGLPGLAVALVLYSKWSNEVNALKAKQSAISASMDNLTIMTTAVGQLSVEITNLSSGLLRVKTAVEIVIGDLKTIVDDVDKRDIDRVVIEMRIRAALVQVNTLAIDTS